MLYMEDIWKSPMSFNDGDKLNQTTQKKYCIYMGHGPSERESDATSL
jgi:hypothetical protein